MLLILVKNQKIQFTMTEIENVKNKKIIFYTECKNCQLSADYNLLFKLLMALWTFQTRDTSMFQLMVPQLGSTICHKFTFFAGEGHLVMFPFYMTFQIVTSDGSIITNFTLEWLISCGQNIKQDDGQQLKA